MSIAVVRSSANTDGLTASAKDAFIEGKRHGCGGNLFKWTEAGALPRLRERLGHLPG